MEIKKAGAVIAVMLVAVAGVLGWRLLGDEPDPGPEDLTAHLVDHWISDFETPYASPQWWTDGTTLGWFGEAAGELSVRSWGNDSETNGLPWSSARALVGGKQVQPLDLAITPGDATAFVAVGVRPVPDAESKQPVLVWTGALDETGEAAKVRAAELPVEVSPTTDSKSIITADTAVVSLGDQTVAVVQISQRGESRLLSCVVGDGPCAWEPLDPPVGGTYVSLGATADALIAIADSERPTVWAASDSSIKWNQVGQAPPDFRGVDVRDGVDHAVAVWPSGDDVAIQTMDADAVTTDVARLTLPDDSMGPFSAVRQDGRWYLGAATEGDAEARMEFDATAAGLWVLDSDAWRRVTDPLLLKQVDQRVVALRVGAEGELLATTASSVLDTVMLWTVTASR